MSTGSTLLRTQDKRLQLGLGLEAVIHRYRAPQTVSYPVATGASSSGINVNTHASANTKGSSFTTLVASTDFDCDGFFIISTGASANVDILFDIAIGAAASETVIVADITQTGATTSASSGNITYIPLYVKAGVRISARSQGSTGGSNVILGVILVRAGSSLYRSLSRATTYGANTADSGGTGIDPGADDHAKGSYAELTAAATNPIKALIVCVGDRANAAIVGTTTHMIDVATGSAGSESVVISDLITRSTATEDTLMPQWFGPFPVDIPAGARLAARCQSNQTDATDRLLDVTVIGFD
jgi:hypothetical protein